VKRRTSAATAAREVIGQMPVYSLIKWECRVGSKAIGTEQLAAEKFNSVVSSPKIFVTVCRVLKLFTRIDH